MVSFNRNISTQQSLLGTCYNTVFSFVIVFVFAIVFVIVMVSLERLGPSSLCCANAATLYSFFLCLLRCLCLCHRHRHIKGRKDMGPAVFVVRILRQWQEGAGHVWTTAY